MALTVIQFETILIKRLGKLLTAVGMDGSTVTGNNPDLVDPMGYSIRHMGKSVTTITNITDADLATFAETDYDELFDMAEYRTLLSIQGNFALVDTKIGPRDEKWGPLIVSVDKLVAAKKKMLDETYLASQWTLTASVVDFDFSVLD